jgi:uncharacterized protein RhaS with RHS repeats
MAKPTMDLLRLELHRPVRGHAFRPVRLPVSRIQPGAGPLDFAGPGGLAAVDPTNPQSWNRYAYALNNPLSFIDPSGMILCDYGPSDNGGNDFEDADDDEECTSNGGTLPSGRTIVPVNDGAPNVDTETFDTGGRPGAARKDVHNTWSGTFPCNKSATQVMSAVQNDMGQFADNRNTVFAANSLTNRSRRAVSTRFSLA